MNGALKAKLEQQLGSPISQVRAAGGGDINQTFALELRDGRKLFLKTHPNPPPAMYPCEARGLEWLGESGALRVPQVLIACDADDLGPACLVMEQIEVGRRGAAFDEALGQGLAALHRYGAPDYGLDHANYIALLEQDNTGMQSWARFYAERRLQPLTRLALSAGRVSAVLAHKVDALCSKLERLVGAVEPPARLHGDLWGGNLLCDEHGLPCLIDPAVYGGHREIDLAMMRLFGGFSERMFAAYAEVYPLDHGHRERVPLYQLYPLLVHVNLFGGHYSAQVEHCLSRWV